jgi:prepilin-type N-terminal cleavage/methylation domain-containing protein
MIFHSTEQETGEWKFFWHQRIRINMNIKANIIRPNRSGFTLIEILVVLIILGILASIAQSKLVDLGDSTENRAIEVGIMELNVREKLTWTDFKLSSSGWTNDNAVFSTMEMNLGAGYSWIAGPVNSGGTLQFKSKSVVLIRTSSTNESASWWK